MLKEAYFEAGTERRVAVLGATGSIGRNALDVIRADRGLEPVLFTANRDADALSALAAEFPEAKIALSGSEAAPGALSGLAKGRVYCGRAGLLAAIAECGANIALNGIAGSAGLPPSFAVLEAGCVLALANKESVVMAGGLLLAEAAKRRLPVLPVDSEHSGVFNLLKAHGRDAVREVIITASGGPFRLWSADALAAATPQDALAHPTWKMGAKISVDSATLANKGLEVIEAARLFGFGADAVRAVIHPQSVVHALVRMRDGAVYAQLSRPDMRLPIHEALSGGRTADCAWGELDFDGLSLSFEKPDGARFPMLPLAYEALKAGELYTVAYNAANECAVAAFLGGRLGFTAISGVCRRVLDADWSGKADCLPAVMDADSRARNLAAAAERQLVQT